MHALPPHGHAARELFEVSHLVDITMGREPVPTLPQALRSARNAFAADTTGAMRRMAFIVVRAEDDQLDLITVGRRGGWRKEWRFGPVGRNARLA